MTIPVPTLTFGTIRRLSLLNIFASAKIDSRLQDVGASLIAIDRAIRRDIAERAIRLIVAVHVAIRADVAVEIGSITVHVGRVHIAANVREYLLYMILFFRPIIYFKTI